MTDTATATLAGTELVLAILIPLLPIVAAAVTFTVGKKLWRGGAMIPIAAITGSLLCSLYFFLRMLRGGEPLAWQTEWFHIGSSAAGQALYPFVVGFQLDNLA